MILSLIHGHLEVLLMSNKKISIAQYNEKVKDVREAKTELSIAEADLAKVEEYMVMDNCSKCKGTG